MRRALVLALLLSASCTNGGSDRVLSVSTTGIVTGYVYFDADGSRSLTAADDSLKSVRVRLVSAGDTMRTVTSALSLASGRYRFEDVPVGAYALRVDTTTIGDSVRVAHIDSASVTVLPGESLFVNVGVGFPAVSVAAARALPVGRRVFVQGAVLNASTGFSDSVAHLQDASGAIRLTRLRSAVAAGDSVRVQGVTARRAGQPTLDDVHVVALGSALVPTPAELSLAAAKSAQGGSRDAYLARVQAAPIASITTSANDVTLHVTSGTDTLEVLLDGNADPVFRPAQMSADYLRGNSFDIVGVLQPTGSGTWRLKPRSAADLTLIPLPETSVAAARLLPVGRLVVVVGVALNGVGTFADTTVHLSDNTGAIRLTRLRAQIAAGDSVRVRATTATRDGQPTLDDVTATALGQGLSPAVTTLTTLAAAGAAGGTRDAQVVRVRGAIISDTLRTPQSFILTVSDSSGPLEVQLDRTADAAFQPAGLPGAYVPGNKFDVLGVLAPSGTGAWRLKPRSAAEMTEIPLPVLSIAAARALPAGRSVVVVGVALNGSATFGDTTVHLADTSGFVRLTRLRSQIAAGDSVKVRATTATRDGQPTLDDVTATALGRGLSPAAVTLTTAVAAGAGGGARDAALAVVRGATINDTATVDGNLRLTLSDGSGNLVVELDRAADASFQAGSLPGVYITGSKFDVIGLLVSSGGGVWRLKPRSAADVTEIPLPVQSLAVVRSLPAGRLVVVVGVALNASATFSDTTVNFADNTGSIRLTRLRTTMAVGDSLRLRATTAIRDGQPTLDDVTGTTLGRGLLPAAVALTTALAATANGGASDAALAVVRGATISDTATVAGDWRITVSDGSGSFEVLLDQISDAAFRLPGRLVDYIPGNRFDIVGVLQPTGAGTWRLKPRSAADLRKL